MKKIFTLLSMVIITFTIDNEIFTFDTKDIKNVTATQTSVYFEFTDNTGYYIEY